jgi:hypothetical protein
MFVAHELDIGDLDLVAFANLERHRAEAANAIAINRVADGHLVVTGLLVIFAELLRILLDLPLVESLVGLNLRLLLETARLHLLVALEPHAEDAKLRRDLDDDVESVRPDFLGFELHEFEKAGAVERADVAIQHEFIELAPIANLHVRAHHLLVHVGRADELDRNRADLI